MHAYTVKVKTADSTVERTVYAAGLKAAAEIGAAHGLVVGVRRRFSVVDMGAAFRIHGPDGAMVVVRYDGTPDYSSIERSTALYDQMLAQVAGRISC